MTNTHTPTERKTRQLKWLRSASILAAASAMVAGGAPAFAQSALSPQVRQISAPADLRVPIQSPVRITNVRSVPTPSVNAHALPVPTAAPSIKHNSVAAPVRSQLAINPTPTPTPVRTMTTTPAPVPAPLSTRTTASGPTSSSPQAAMSVNGVSVNAIADF